jgi:acetolactate synthase regulatory subunit
MRYKQLVEKKLAELKNYIHSQNANISQLRPPDELKQQLEKMLDKIQEIQVLINTEDEAIRY